MQSTMEVYAGCSDSQALLEPQSLLLRNILSGLVSVLKVLAPEALQQALWYCADKVVKVALALDASGSPAPLLAVV